ncbi:MAG: hypothetical protein HY076_06245 [Candidatus Eisenbacteria bacterium]|uniref:DUF6249 domain-containing protein n=1 Tax=Eiseniibacteriota bacterium TaxID=2212470 RepID=A0A9D6QK23_UNCEI|nr:hypothetical protein [Candidatus Eisenbacteria bacterium]MBI3539855.1 hypothetical protein [Candidatus Eisenbacteria bacterium]
MWIPFVNVEAFIPIIALSIPIVAIVGGITAGIIRTLGRQRLIELAQRERIAAIERGVDPSKLAPLPLAALDDEPEGVWSMSQRDRDHRRAQGLLIGGIVTVAVGLGLMAFLNFIEDNGHVWAVGIIPASVGVALLISWFLVRPRRNGGAGTPPGAPPSA